jgi:uncharacterized ferritin-like protein (DUF455 family)
MVRYAAPVLRGPFNMEARRRAGFSEGELATMQAAAGNNANANANTTN